jgi:hypothetical protein
MRFETRSSPLPNPLPGERETNRFGVFPLPLHVREFT